MRTLFLDIYILDRFSAFLAKDTDTFYSIPLRTPLAIKYIKLISDSLLQSQECNLTVNSGV
jgi:hypothetical protein